MLSRRYREGEKLTYPMVGSNEGWRYEIQADGIVKKEGGGTYFEEYRWSNLISNNEKVALSSADLDFREEVSLDPHRNPALPNLSRMDRRLIGPITDFLTFYADLWLAAKINQLARPGDHFYFKRGVSNSWADGHYVRVGEDAVDFDVMLKEYNRTNDTAALLARHVPPEKPEIKLPAEWMHKPVANAANNWVQVQRVNDTKYLAAVGMETFDVEIKLSVSDGKILSGSMENPLQTVERECADAALTKCGDPKPHAIKRHVEIFLERQPKRPD